MSSAALCLLLSITCAANVQADYVIRGAVVHDGTGEAGRKADVAIRGERIVAVGQFDVDGNPRVIDGTGLVVAPGFIDLHTHCDGGIVQPATRLNLNYLTQGVTTIVTGNCGSGPVDVAAYFKKIEEGGAGTNVVHLLPQGSLRRQVLGEADRPATPNELDRMKQLADRAMRDGAWGMSSGLIYVPSLYATTDELSELMKVVAQHGGFYATHMRNENTRILESIEEALEIGRRSGAPVHLSHFKVSGQKAWGMAADAIQAVRNARAKGQVVTADQYPYIASSTSLSATTIPARYRSTADLTEILNDEEKGPKLRAEIERMLTDRGNGQNIVVASYAKQRAWQGKNLKQLAEQEGKPVLDIVLEIHRNGGASIVNFGMSEEEVRLIMQEPFVATASDGSTQDPSADTLPHPRSYGTFPRKIGRYGIAGKTISVEHAIRSSSGLPADILKLPERGYLKAGYYADVVVFDPATFTDTATFDKPHAYATGVRYLFVNGGLAIDGEKSTGELKGWALRHSTPQDRNAD
jgi:N-acyl-D-amino-acid deacylase